MKMVPIGFVIWIAITEVMFFLLLYDFERPDKKTRENIRQFADEYNMSERAATNWILRSFFKAYEQGLREKMRENYKRNNPTFEEWKAEQDKKFEEDLKKLQEHKQIVKPRKIQPNKTNKEEKQK